MPQEITQHYHFGGWTTQAIWSEQEMAEALGMSVAELRGRLDPGEYDKQGKWRDEFSHVGLSFHAHPLSNSFREFQFNAQSFLGNIKVWSCVQEGGHFYEDNPKYDYLPKGAQTCTGCGYTKYG